MAGALLALQIAVAEIVLSVRRHFAASYDYNFQLSASVRAFDGHLRAAWSPVRQHNIGFCVLCLLFYVYCPLR